ncbi:MAG TPA: thiolase family protein [Dehalococcoidia bacterium]|nr:thiolase family protein [Dehalococcoidia bacterium]
MAYQAKSAIVGLGISDVGKVYGRSATSFALEAIDRALEDAGLKKEHLDGLLMQSGISQPGIGLQLQNAAGLKNLRLVNHMNAMGATPASMVQYATMAIQNGLATTVACVFADAPMQDPNARSSAGMNAARGNRPATGFASLDLYYGPMNPNAGYAMAARRHMATYGTTSEQLGAIAVSTRAWAVNNPIAQFRTPITVEDHQNSRWIAEPFHLLDCCLISNGSVAVIVTSAERGADMKSKPAYVLSMAQGFPGNTRRAGDDHDWSTGAAIARDTLYGTLGISAKDIDICELYDCYTYTTLVTLEDYGFRGKGEGGPFVQTGVLGPGGALPTNTGGGELSSFYLWGMTPLSEGVIQARGSGGDRQVAKHDLVLVTGNGGLLDYHASLILSPEAA